MIDKKHNNILYDLFPSILSLLFVLIFNCSLFSTIDISCRNASQKEFRIEQAFGLKKHLEGMDFIDRMKQDSLIDLFYCMSQKTDNIIIKASALTLIGAKFFENSYIEEARKPFEEILLINEKDSIYKEIAEAHNYLSIIMSMEGRPIDAYKHNIALLDICKKHRLPLMPKAYLNIGQFHYETKDYNQAETFYLQGIEIAEAIKISPHECGWLLHRLGELYRTLNRTKDALFFINKAMNHWDKIDDERGKSFTMLQLAIVYDSLDNKKRAYEILNEINTICEENDYRLCQLKSLSYMGRLAFSEKKYAKTIECIEKCDAMRLKYSIPFRFESNYKLLAETYAAIDKPKKANESYKNYLIEVKSNLENENRITKEWVENNKDLLNKKEYLTILEERRNFDQKKMDLQHKYIAASCLVLLFISLFAFSLFQSNRKSIKYQKKLLALNKTISKQSEQLQIANENVVKQKGALELELVKKLLMLSKQAEAVQKMDAQLKNMSESSENMNLRKLITNVKNDSIWNELDLQITQSNRLLFEKLSQKFDNLSQSDLRLCAFLKMNMRTKEIANLTFKNPASVKVARSRLRKKLGLTHSNTTISTFLNRL